MKAAFLYEPGAVRWRRFDGNGDVRGYRPAKGWSAEAMVLDRHPITGKPITTYQWWIKETYEGDVE